MLNSKDDILKNIQYKYDNIKYEYENMIGCSNVGNTRERQEDSILLLNHKDNLNFCLIAVADGMGGLANGEVASNVLMRNLIDWFESLTNKCYLNVYDTYCDLLSNIGYFDVKVRNICPGGGTTLALAIVTQNDTLCLNVGDSRIYLYNNSILEQVSVDHSIAWMLYDKGIINKKEEIKFYKEKNLIMSCFGDPKYRLFPTVKIVSNNQYDYIILLTDGITDILDDKEIELILKANGFEMFMDSIISQAMGKLKFQNYLDDDKYYTEVVGGCDNLSGVIMKNKVKRRIK